MVNGSLKYTEELEFYIRGNNTANRVAIVALVEDLCGVLAIVEDSNGTIFLLGWSEDLDLDRPLKMASDASGSGKELTDLAGSTITMVCLLKKLTQLLGLLGQHLLHLLYSRVEQIQRGRVFLPFLITLK
jgi:hypothetical protein